jgi:hypothetical protein
VKFKCKFIIIDELLLLLLFLIFVDFIYFLLVVC